VRFWFCFRFGSKCHARGVKWSGQLAADYNRAIGAC
jgi:hypothetical protein